MSESKSNWVQVELPSTCKCIIFNLNNIEDVVVYVKPNDDIALGVHYVSSRYEEYKDDDATAIWSVLKPIFSGQ